MLQCDSAMRQCQLQPADVAAACRNIQYCTHTKKLHGTHSKLTSTRSAREHCPHGKHIPGTQLCAWSLRNSWDSSEVRWDRGTVERLAQNNMPSYLCRRTNVTALHRLASYASQLGRRKHRYSMQPAAELSGCRLVRNIATVAWPAPRAVCLQRGRFDKRAFTCGRQAKPRE